MSLDYPNLDHIWNLDYPIWQFLIIANTYSQVHIKASAHMRMVGKLALLIAAAKRNLL